MKIMKTKFKTFTPYMEYRNNGSKVCYRAADALNQWLEENPKVEIISWQATAVAAIENDVYITIQYRELED
jgi:hypothetical protein